MKRPNELENILDECLEMVFGGESIEACLDKYPEYAEDLKPLLETIVDARGAADIKPRPEFKRQAFYDFQSAVRDLPPLKAAGFFSLRQWWVTATAVVAVIVFGGGGAVMASGSSLPDSFLYSVKLATESTRIALTFSDEGKTELYARFADRRVDEMVVMAEQGNSEAVNLAADNLDRQLVAMVNVVVPGEGDSGTAETAMMFSEAAEAPQAAPAPAALTVPRPTPAPATDESVTEPSVSVGANGDIKAAAPPARSEGEEPALPERSTITPVGEPRREGEEPSLFKQDITGQATEAIRKLQAALATAPEEARPALEKALELLYERYDVVISNIR